MTLLLPGVEPIVKNGQLQFVTTSKHDTTGSKAPHLQIEHSYHTKAHFVHEQEHHHVLASYITLKNLSQEVTLSNIKVYIDFDDTAQSLDAYICDAEGTHLVLQDDYKIVFDQPLTPGASSAQRQYFWTVKHRGAPELHQSKNFTVTPNISPAFSVHYTEAAMFSSDVTEVEVGS
ncbi:MAG: hypothetical protein AAF560_23590 [Acidobacteriota bacterium]